MTKIYKSKNRKISKPKRIKQIQKPTEISPVEPAKIINQPPIEKNKTKVKETKESGVITKYYGTKTFIDTETGQPIELEYFDKAIKHTLPGGWKRVYIETFMEILTDLTNSKKLSVVEYILANLDSENKFTKTQAQISEAIKVSRPIVIQTYKYLISINFMKKTGLCYTINPKFVCAWGSDKKNARILINYHEAEPTLFD